MGRDESSIDVVEDVGPDFTNIVNLVEGTDGRVTERVGGSTGRVRVGTDTSGVPNDVRTESEVRDRRGLLLSPLSESVGPTLTHTTGLSGLEATTSSTTSQTVGDTVGVLCDEEVLSICVGYNKRASKDHIPREQRYRSQEHHPSGGW